MSPWLSFCNDETRLACACCCSCLSIGSGGGGGGVDTLTTDELSTMLDQMAIERIRSGGNARQTQKLLDRGHAIKAEAACQREPLIAPIKLDHGAVPGIGDQYVNAR